MNKLILILAVIGLTGCAGQVSDVMEGLGKGTAGGTPPVCSGVMAQSLVTEADECAKVCADVACMRECLTVRADQIDTSKKH